MWWAISIAVITVGAVLFALAALFCLWRIEDSLGELILRLPEKPFLPAESTEAE